MEYTIVFQGLLSDKSVELLNNIPDYGVEMHVVTWRNASSNHLHLKEAFKVHLLEDPGSFEAYCLGQVRKDFNLDRLFYCLEYIHSHLRTDVVVKCRVDCVVDFNHFVQLFFSSNKMWASVGVNTICPNRFSSDPLLWVVSDWIFAYRRSEVDFSIWNYFRTSLTENRETVSFGNYEWKISLGAEQVLSMHLSGQSNEILKRSIKAKLALYTHDDWVVHKVIQERTLNVPPNMVGFRSCASYRGGYSVRWIRHSTSDFSDNSMFSWKLHWLVIRLVVKFRLWL